MTAAITLPALPEAWEPTRASLHAYAQAAVAVPRTHAPAHPRWWHVSLEVTPLGLMSDPMPLPDGGSAVLVLDLRHHEVRLADSSGKSVAVSMRSGLTGSEMAARLIAAAADLGLSGDYDESKYASDEERHYDPDHAAAFWEVLVAVDGLLRRHRADLEGTTSPVQLWPHGFDLSFEWFGTKTAQSEGEDHPAQLNLGFYPGGDAYFYSNPWPFDESLVEKPLPEGAVWHTEGWQGTMLPHAAVAGSDDAAQRVLGYAAAVHEIARPTLMKD